MKAAAPISPVAPTSQGAARKGAPAPVGASLAAGLASGGGASTWAGLLDAAAAQPTAPEDVAVEDELLDVDADGGPLPGSVLPHTALGHPGAQAEAPASPELASHGDELYGAAIFDDADPAEWQVGANPRATLGHPGASAETGSSLESSVHGADSTGVQGESLAGDADLPEWQVGANPRAALGQAAIRAASLGPQAELGRPSASLGPRSGAPAAALQASAGTDDLSSLVAAFSRPDSKVADRQGRGLGVGEPGARALDGARLGGAPPLDAEKPTAPTLAANPRGTSSVRSASPVDLLGPAPRAAATFDAAPWLGLEPAPAAESSVRPDGHTPAAPSGLREALAASTPARFALISDQVAAEASARAAALTRGDVEADRSRPAAPTAPRALPAPRAALEVAERAPPAEAPIEPVGRESDPARRPTLAAAARVATRAPTPTPASPSALPIAGDAVATTPGANAALPAATTVTRVHTLQAATVVDARFTDGQVPQQIGAPDLTRVEIEVEEGDHALKVTLAREADGLAVEVRGPREVVAELRALRPEVDAALAEEGFDLTAYDADEDPDAGSRDADDDDALEGEDTPTPTATASADGAPRGRAGLLDRQA